MQISLKAEDESEPKESGDHKTSKQKMQKRMAKGKLLSNWSLVAESFVGEWPKMAARWTDHVEVGKSWPPKALFITRIVPVSILTLPLPDLVSEIAYECWPIGFG